MKQGFIVHHFTLKLISKHIKVFNHESLAIWMVGRKINFSELKDLIEISSNEEESFNLIYIFIWIIKLRIILSLNV